MEQTVLGHLAGTGWFGRHGEVALTGGLAFCLRKDPAAGTGLLDLLRERTNVAIAGPVTWQAESASEGGRVDIDAVKEGTRAPVLRIEGKVFAPFEDRQVSSYVADQLAKLSECGIDAGVLVVVVPESRVRTVAREVAALLVAECDANSGGEHLLVVAAGASVTVCILSWDAVFEAAEASAGPARHDLRQLLGHCPSGLGGLATQRGPRRCHRGPAAAGRVAPGDRRRWSPLGSPGHRGTAAGKARNGTDRADG